MYLYANQTDISNMSFGRSKMLHSLKTLSRYTFRIYAHISQFSGDNLLYSMNGDKLIFCQYNPLLLDHSWVHLERIQFVGACNPPTDPGRKPLSHRLLRHVPVIYVDYPGETSLEQVKISLLISSTYLSKFIGFSLINR